MLRAIFDAMGDNTDDEAERGGFDNLNTKYNRIRV